jgi:hypothetical protein
VSSADDARLRDLLNGFQATEALLAAVELGLPATLSSGSRSLVDLAEATNSRPDLLGRLMRTLSSLDVVALDAQGRYHLTPLGQRMRPDVEGSWHAWARMIGSPAIRASWGRLADALRSGTTGFAMAHGSDIWTWRSHHPADNALFDAAMRSGTERIAVEVARCMGDLAGLHLLDVGGGDGALLAHLLMRNPGASGSLLERGSAAERAREWLTRHGLRERASVVEGDFFMDVPPYAHRYILKFVLHDWEDEQAIRILQRCRDAMQDGQEDVRLVLIERLLDAVHGSQEASLSDLNMLVNTGGRERTREEFASLLDLAGFALTTCEVASGSLHVMHARPT